jgi:pantoate--beta-alanine ligase
MQILRTIPETRAACRCAQTGGKRLGLVPTMGALHGGHLSLVRLARAQCDVVAVSIFVNPIQFGPHEDLARYPRPFERDCDLLRDEKVDLLFAPIVEEMYPHGALTYVTVEEMSARLCGRTRPGHFRGVTTVVSKLFHIVGPDVAYFGQKDAAQVAILRKMVVDQNLPVQIQVGPIIRESDGLAMSSRNAYLNPEQRQQALVLYRSLARVRELFEKGERGSSRLISAAQEVFRQEPAVCLDYFEIVDSTTLLPVADANGALVAVAAFVGTTRLIDNILLDS